MKKILRTWKRVFSFRSLTIQQRLPLLIGLLLLSVIICFGVISYFTMRNEALNAGQQKVQNLGHRFSNMLMQSTQAMITANRDAALDTSIRNYIHRRNNPEKALSVLQKLAVDSQTVLVQLLDKHLNSVLLQYEKDYLHGRINYANLKITTASGEPTRIGKLKRSGDSLYYPVVTSVRLSDTVAGHLVRWRQLYNSPRALEQLSQLIGADATIYMGNADDSHWTNMVRPIPSPIPPGTDRMKDLLRFKNANGDELMASLKPVANAPWFIMVALPTSSFTSPVRKYLQQLIIISGILLAGGLLIGWRVSQNITKPLNKLTGAAAFITNGNYTAVVPLERKDEVGKLSRSFNTMSSQVSQAKKELEKKIEESKQMNARLREFSASMENIREEERKHIAREMHDELGQFLTGLKMDLRWLDKRIHDSKDNAEVLEKVKEMTKVVDEAVLFVRKLAAELRPSILDDLGLIAALEWHSQEFSKRFNIEVIFRSELPDLKIPQEVATGIFRMYQESLTNVARHANAGKVTTVLEADDFIQLTIHDDGKGFDTEVAGNRKTLGLLGMKERAAMIGGKIDILSSVGLGTTIIIRIPLFRDQAVPHQII